MRCELMGPRLSAWVDGELSGVSGWLVSRHVASCETCAAEVESLRALNVKLSAANPVLTPIAPRNRAYPSAVLGMGAATALAGLTLFLLLPRQSSTVVSVAQEKPATRDLKQVALASPAPEVSLSRDGVQMLPVAERFATNAAPVSVYHANSAKRSSEPNVAPARRASTVSKSRTRRVGRKVRRERAPEIVRVVVRKRVAPVSKPDEPVRVALAEAAQPMMYLPQPVEKPTEREASAPPRPAAITPPAVVTAAPMARAARTRTELDHDDAGPRRVRAVLVITPTRYENVVLVQPGAMEIDDESKGSEGEPPPP
jgi:anti-sigma factor RsiW